MNREIDPRDCQHILADTQQEKLDRQDHTSEAYRLANADDFRSYSGATTEGHYFYICFEYAPNAPGNAQPIRITGSYDANDGPGTFDVTRWQDLPGVITESEDF